jgi:multicomponent Na+:H+ antiporter subunit D
MAPLVLTMLIVVPAVGALGAMLAWRRPVVQAALALAMSGVSLALSAWLLANSAATPTLAVGGWLPPVGIGFRADGLSRLMLALTGTIFTAATAYHLGQTMKGALGTQSPAANLAWPMLLLSLNGLFLTADFFNFYVFFELLAVSSYLLVSQGKHHPLEAAWKYSAQSVLGSLSLLVGIVLLYGATGSLAMADVAQRLDGPVWWLAPFFLIAFFLKGALFPFHFWQPDAHAAASTAGSMVLAGLLIKVGLYSFLRFWPPLMGPQGQAVFLAVGTLSIGFGAVAAWRQTDAKRLLGFSSVSQLGFVLIGLGFGTAAAVAAAIFYMINHSLTKALLFVTTGALSDRAGTTAFAGLQGSGGDRPGLNAAYLLGVASLVGLPPTVGFIGKLGLLGAGVRAGEWAWVAVMGMGSLLTLGYGLRAYQLLFWAPKGPRKGPEGPGPFQAPLPKGPQWGPKGPEPLRVPSPGGPAGRPGPGPLTGAVVTAMAGGVVLAALAAQPLWALCAAGAAELLGGSQP